MPAPDRSDIRRAVDQFRPRRRSRFQNLVPWNEEIVALREKGASCEAIAELLTQHGVRTSRTMVSEYLAGRSGAKSRRKQRPLATVSADKPALTDTSIAPAVLSSRPNALPAAEASVPKTRGPRIAQVELIKPTET